MDRLFQWAPFAITIGAGVTLGVRAHADVTAIVGAWLYLGLLWATFQLGRGRYY